MPTKYCPFFFKRTCGKTVKKYQSFDGSCNNLNKPWLGKTSTPYKRFLPPKYDDGFSTPRTLAVSNNLLPNPRSISRAIFDDNGQWEKIWTHIFAIFGQFLTHDLTSLSITSGKLI